MEAQTGLTKYWTSEKWKSGFQAVRFALDKANLIWAREVVHACQRVIASRQFLCVAVVTVAALALFEMLLLLALNSIAVTETAAQTAYQANMTATEYSREAAEPIRVSVRSSDIAKEISPPLALPKPIPASALSEPIPASTMIEKPADAVTIVAEPTQEITQVFTETDVELLAKLMWGEARGIESEREKAAVAWCALNRVGTDEAEMTLLEVLEKTDQFTGFSHDNPITGNLLYLARDVYDRWERERNMGSVEGRVLPKDYVHFFGDGVKNTFYTGDGSVGVWKWQLPDPYPALRAAKMREYTPTNDEIIMMAKVLYGTARNVKAKKEQAAVVWCILNRVASPLYPDTVEEVITQPGQFPSYHEDNQAREKLLKLAADVTQRWCREMRGEEEVGRVLPKNYLYFYGKNRRNWFRDQPRSKRYWTWKLADPYTVPVDESEPNQVEGVENGTTTKFG